MDEVCCDYPKEKAKEKARAKGPKRKNRLFAKRTKKVNPIFIGSSIFLRHSAVP